MFLITTIFIGIFLEVLVYGVYVTTFIRHVRILVLRRKKLPPKTFIYLSTASLLLFVVVTVTLVADLIFATHIFKNPADPIDFSGYSTRRSINVGCCVFAIVISNAILLYRSYILYNSRLCIVALPLLVFVVECGVGIWSICPQVSSNTVVDPWSTHHHRQKLTLALAIFGFVSGAMNVMCTSLIIAYMWRSHRRLLAAGVHNLQSPSAYARVGAILINSAAINIVWWLGVFVTSTISSLLYEVYSAPYACVTALIFSTIIVSASRTPSSESFQVTPISFPPQAFPQGSMPSTDSLSANDMLEVDVQLTESFSLERSNNGVSPKETV
ncbi:hypothetical protein BDP27DRAFT_260962 [Rhodocollybia butyracea]|uniref:Uncharacterized protein n=1 Tax=Rhodocollybia butyracea TaxID=206335 RepID=A0A9P5UC23_9AGAR|nr:hypothetical protein BDP27DRAFT_260962 [Rhodocollybia butyracea]